MGCCDTYGFVCHVCLIIMATAGVVLSFLTLFSCDFLETTNVSNAQDLTGDNNGLPFYFGLFFFTDINGECAVYPADWQFNTASLCAQVCAFIAPILSTIALLFYLWEFLFCRFCCARLIQGFLLFGAFVAQGLTFLAFDDEQFCESTFTNITNDFCTISNGAIYSITAFSCFFVVGCIGCCTPKPRPMIKRCGDGDDDEDDHGKKKKDDDEPKEDEPEVEEVKGGANTSASAPMYDAVYE